MDEQQDYRVFWIVALGLLLLTRIPAMAQYMSIDNVNLAFSLERFDPRIHQPQPPGYPFFVLFGRILNVLFRDAERTFVAASLIATGLCLPSAFLLGRRMFSQWAGAAAAFLVLLNPVVWHSSLDGPLRPHLALFSLVTAYCCWRCWSGEKQFAMWGAIALGIGSGFRPDLIAFMFPVWFVSAWVGTKSWVAVARAGAVFAAICLVWAVALVWSMGGVDSFSKVMFDYTVDQSKPESLLLGSTLRAWLRQINRLVIWNGLAVVTWIWAVPFFVKHRDRLPVASPQAAFFFVWLVPGLIVQALIHVAAPGHTLFSVAALCVLGGYVISLAPAREALLGAALAMNVMLFLDFFPLPANTSNTAAGTPSLKNAALFGTFESSIGEVRWLDDITRVSLREIEQFTPKDRPSVIVSTNTYVSQWFMNWRIGRYYLPDRDMWILYNELKEGRGERIRRDAVLEARNGSPVTIPVPREGRILWLIEPQSEIHKAIAARGPLQGGQYVFYSDITPDAAPFKVDRFEFVPTIPGP